MECAVCSRESNSDYAWKKIHAPEGFVEFAREKIAPAFEGLRRFAAFMRCSSSPPNVMLCVSVSTNRTDFRHRPIRTMALLRAEEDEESRRLAAFFTRCLSKPDQETLYDAESDIAQAVEGIYQTNVLDGFVQYCHKLLPAMAGQAARPVDRWAFPRGDLKERRALVESLPAMVEGDKPFLAVLTDREPSAVLESLGSLFDHGMVRIFSKEVSEAKALPEKGGPKKYWIGGGLGSTVVLCGILLAVHTYSGHVATSGGDGERGPDKVVAPSTPRDVGQPAPTGGVIPPAAPNPPESPMVPVVTPKPGDGEATPPEIDAGILAKEDGTQTADSAVRDTEPSEKVSSGNREDVENDSGEVHENTVPPPSVTQVAVELAPDALKPVKMPTGPAVDPKPDTAESDVPGDQP